jgi:hypothetical protein
MKTASDPVIKLLAGMMLYAVDDVRKKVPSACPRNEREEAKRTARDFFNTKFYEACCDMLNIPADRARTKVLSEESTEEWKPNDELPELPI